MTDGLLASRRAVEVHTAVPDEVCACLGEDALAAALPDGERARAGRFARDRDRRAYLVAHHLLRTSLSRLGAGAPRDILLVKGPHGRPELREDLGISFNLSHTDGLVACAISEHVTVGVDVERERELSRFPSMMHGVLTTAEANALFALPEPDRLSRFFRTWTAKEAYAKAIGKGLGLPLDRVALVETTSGPELVGANDLPACVTLELRTLPPSHHLAVATLDREHPEP